MPAASPARRCEEFHDHDLAADELQRWLGEPQLGRADGFAAKFILRDSTASYGQEPLYLRELMTRWKDGGYRQ